MLSKSLQQLGLSSEAGASATEESPHEPSPDLAHALELRRKGVASEEAHQAARTATHTAAVAKLSHHKHGQRHDEALQHALGLRNDNLKVLLRDVVDEAARRRNAQRPVLSGGEPSDIPDMPLRSSVGSSFLSIHHPKPTVPTSFGDYGGELQVVEDFRSQSILFSDLTDGTRWSCWSEGPKPRSGALGAADQAGTSLYEPPAAPKKEGGGGGGGLFGGLLGGGTKYHPQLELNEPHGKVHVHLEDKAAEYASGRVLWDATYDMGNTEVLKGDAVAIPGSGTQEEFHQFCPPTTGPAHWYELTVTRPPKAGTRPNPNRAVEDFLGAQYVTTYRPDQDPEINLFGAGKPQSRGGGCTVM